MGRGRKADGPKLVESLAGSPEAKRRCRVILETLGGQRSVAEACKELGIEEARYHQLKLQALAAAVAGLEAGVPGRPRKEEPAESAQVKALLEERKRLLFELQIARTREEIAVALPRVLTGPEADKPASPAEKKTTRPPPIITKLEEMVARVRKVWRKKGWMLIHVLRWTQPGYVWAMDFMQPPTPVDGIYRWVLAVRDLGSGEMLLTLPVYDMTARTVRDVLESLFLKYVRPLLMKSDNGSGFIDGETRDFLNDRRVLLLLSPPGLPSYNGSIEAGIGGFETRAHYESARNDRPGQWTPDDVEGARQQANQTARPFGLYGPTPDDVWQCRDFPDDKQRSDFADLVRRYQDETWAEWGYLPGTILTREQQNAIDRVAISRALIEAGFLVIRRRRYPLPIWRAKLKDIS